MNRLVARMGLFLIAVVLGLVLFWVMNDSPGERGHESRQPVETSKVGARTTPTRVTQESGIAGSRTREATEPQRDAGGTVAGRVVYNGTGVEGAGLHAIRADEYALDLKTQSRYSVPVLSEADGRFSLSLAQAGPFVLVCRKRGLRPATVAFDAIPPGPVTIELLAGVNVTGRVVDRAGNPIVGAHAVARAYSVSHALAAAGESRWPGPDTVDYAHATTDDAGRFVLDGLDPRRVYVVEASAEGYGLVRSSVAAAERHVEPPADVGDIVLTRVLVAVFGLRRGDVEYTRTVDVGKYSGLARVAPPDGFEFVFRRAPADRFPADVAARLRALEDRGGVEFFRPRGPDVSLEPAPEMKITLLREGTKAAEVRVPLRSLGAPGWDRRTWYELPPSGGPPPGRVRIEGKGWPEAFALRSKRVGLFETKRDGDTHVVSVPPGAYTLRRSGTGVFGRTWDVDVKSEETVELRIPPPDAVLTVDPRSSSGAPLREVGILIRRDRRILYRALEPFGCGNGPLRLPIEGALAGRIDLRVTKLGYEGARIERTLGSDNVHWTPSLDPRPR